MDGVLTILVYNGSSPGVIGTHHSCWDFLQEYDGLLVSHCDRDRALELSHLVSCLKYIPEYQCSLPPRGHCGSKVPVPKWVWFPGPKRWKERTSSLQLSSALSLLNKWRSDSARKMVVLAHRTEDWKHDLLNATTVTHSSRWIPREWLAASLTVAAV